MTPEPWQANYDLWKTDSGEGDERGGYYDNYGCWHDDDEETEGDE